MDYGNNNDASEIFSPHCGLQALKVLYLSGLLYS